MTHLASDPLWFTFPSPNILSFSDLSSKDLVSGNAAHPDLMAPDAVLFVNVAFKVKIPKSQR